MKSKEVKRKEAEERAKVSTYIREDRRCATCKYHANSPSYCSNLKRFVGRKQTCTDYKRR